MADRIYKSARENFRPGLRQNEGYRDAERKIFEFFATALSDRQDRVSLWQGLDESSRDLIPGGGEVKTTADGGRRCHWRPFRLHGLEAVMVDVDQGPLLREISPQRVLDEFNELKRCHYDQLRGRSRGRCC